MLNRGKQSIIIFTVKGKGSRPNMLLDSIILLLQFEPELKKEFTLDSLYERHRKIDIWCSFPLQKVIDCLLPYSAFHLTELVKKTLKIKYSHI